MVSALWKACSEGNVEKVAELLNESTQVDVEIKDEAGITPLIEAVKNGHVAIVQLLLEKGADPNYVSSQGPAEQFTSDATIIELLNEAKNKISSHTTVYPQDPGSDPTKGYYGPPPGAYFYPGMPVPPPMLPDGAVAYYPPPPPPPHLADHSGNGVGNLPPPEIARMIPCRYYPACRYGASCMFAHPQGPYLQGPLPPPAQYPTPYDPMAPAPYPPAYYPVPPPGFQPPPNMNPLSPTLPNSPTAPGANHPPMTHTRSGSELVSPVQPFSPTGAPPMPYGMPPVSPTYGHPGPIPVPIPVPPPVGGPQSPQHAMYAPTSPAGIHPPPVPYGVSPPMAGQPYPPHGAPPAGTQPENVVSPKSPTGHGQQQEGYVPAHRESFGHHRRGSARRPSFNGPNRKPPCLFFPSGRCRNGDDCGFPHVLPGDNSHHPHQPAHFAPRGPPRPRPSVQTNGLGGVGDKFAGLTTQDGEPREGQLTRQNVNGNISNGSSRSQSSEPNARGRGPNGYRSGPAPNGQRFDKKQLPPKPQRVPSADEFPVLAGSSTPPQRSPGGGNILNGWTGPTAAQVLQAPPPPRKDSQPSTRSGSPTNGRQTLTTKGNKSELTNGISQPKETSTPAPIATHASANKLPVSFAAVATATAPETIKEVSVTA